MISTPATIENLSKNSSYLEVFWHKRLEALLAKGIASGADLVEVFLENIDHVGLLAEQDIVTSVSPSFGRGAGIRIFKDKKDGFVSTNDLTKHGLKLVTMMKVKDLIKIS